MKFISPLNEEINICKKSSNYNRDSSPKINYFYKIFNKPWGREYLVYQNERIGIWILHINDNQRTSVHCHFKKDTILIPIKGTFRIDLYNSYEILNELEKLYIPKNTFHGLGSYKDDSVIMEIEIYTEGIKHTDKNDLLRLRDNYNRDKHTYENSVKEEDMKDNKIINFHDNDNFVYGDTEINISEIPNELSDLIMLISGVIYQNNVINPPSIINTDKISYLSNQCKFLSFQNNYLEENKKIIYNKKHLQDLLSLNSFTNIGLTSGCFDIMHVGHINFLKKCRKQCDKLFVCLSSDKQINCLKGNNRPINNINDRIRMITCMKYVDYVILYNEIDSNLEKELDNIMNIINPDFWFKGDDYKEEDIIVKHPSLKQIILFENIKYKSTTNIVNKIKGNVS